MALGAGDTFLTFKYSWNKLWFCKNDLSQAQPMTSCEWVRLQKMICNLPSNAAYNTTQGGWEELTKCLLEHISCYWDATRVTVTPCYTQRFMKTAWESKSLHACRNLLFRSISRHLLAPNWTSVAGADLAKSFKPKSSFNAAICWNYHLQIYYDLLIASNSIVMHSLCFTYLTSEENPIAICSDLVDVLRCSCSSQHIPAPTWSLVLAPAAKVPDQFVGELSKSQLAILKTCPFSIFLPWFREFVQLWVQSGVSEAVRHYSISFALSLYLSRKNVGPSLPPTTVRFHLRDVSMAFDLNWLEKVMVQQMKSQPFRAWKAPLCYVVNNLDGPAAKKEETQPLWPRAARRNRCAVVFAALWCRLKSWPQKASRTVSDRQLIPCRSPNICMVRTKTLHDVHPRQKQNKTSFYPFLFQMGLILSLRNSNSNAAPVPVIGEL